MKRTLAFLLLCAMPLAASAQVPPATVPARAYPGMQPAMNPHPNGITVNGSAMRKTAATSARLTIYLYSYATPPHPGAAAPTPAPLDATRIAPLVEALVSMGVARENITIPSSFAPQDRSATIVATVANPTATMIQNGISTVGHALTTMPGLSLGNAQIMLESNHCNEATDAARSAAIANARAKALATAKDLGVHLGPVLNVIANDQSTQTGSCTWQYFMGQGNMPQISSPDDWISVQVFSNVTITYAIK